MTAHVLAMRTAAGICLACDVVLGAAAVTADAYLALVAGIALIATAFAVACWTAARGGRSG